VLSIAATAVVSAPEYAFCVEEEDAAVVVADVLPAGAVPVGNADPLTDVLIFGGAVPFVLLPNPPPLRVSPVMEI
jgi:hypothetical protein